MGENSSAPLVGLLCTNRYGYLFDVHGGRVTRGALGKSIRYCAHELDLTKPFRVLSRSLGRCCYSGDVRRDFRLSRITCYYVLLAHGI
jgi:hypothetical protein